ncbi:hypothetical protein JCM3774_001456 [Rhodotorula dairenensis]
MSDNEYEDPFGAELGAFDIVADSSAATARQRRIEAARKAARTYQAKIEEPGWYNSVDPDSGAKDLSRLVLYSLHHKYYERRYLEVVDAGCEVMTGDIKEQSEVIDLVLRSAVKCDVEVQRRKQVLDLARRWREYPHLASLSLASARILSANSPLAGAADTAAQAAAEESPAAATSERDVADGLTVSAGEVVDAALASLRLHPTLPIPRAFLASVLLRAGHPLLYDAISAPTAGTPSDRPEAAAELEGAIARLCLDGDSESEKGDAAGTLAGVRRDILRRVVGLQPFADEQPTPTLTAGTGTNGVESGAASDSRAVGRSVRSL